MSFSVQEFRESIEKLTLDELLGQLEIDISRVGHNSPDASLKMLLKMDRVGASLEEMAQKQNAVKAEAAQFEYIVDSLEKNARSFLKDMGGKEKLQEVRQAVAPGSERRWWNIDQTYAAQIRSGLRRTVIAMASLAVLLVALVILYNRFLAPDPSVAKRYSLELDADQAMEQGDYARALANINQALADTPQDAGLLALRGVLNDRLGKKDESASDLAKAESLAVNREQFLLYRAQAWIKVDAFDQGMRDVQACLREFPSSAQGHYFLGRVYELRQSYNQALDAYGKASSLAEQQGMTELNATIRITMAMLMQSIPAVIPTASAAPTK